MVDVDGKNEVIAVSSKIGQCTEKHNNPDISTNPKLSQIDGIVIDPKNRTKKKKKKRDIFKGIDKRRCKKLSGSAQSCSVTKSRRRSRRRRTAFRAILLAVVIFAICYMKLNGYRLLDDFLPKLLHTQHKTKRLEALFPEEKESDAAIEQDRTTKIPEVANNDNKPMGKSILKRLFQRVGRTSSDELVDNSELLYYVEKYRTAGSSKRKQSFLQQLLLARVEIFKI